MMITRLTYKIFQIAIELGYWWGATPYYWDSKNNRVLFPKHQIELWISKCSLWFSYISAMIVIPTYIWYLNENGFYVNDKVNVFQFRAICTTVITVVCQRCIHFHMFELHQTTNQLFEFYDTVIDKFNIKPWNTSFIRANLCGIFFGLLIVTGVGMPIFSTLLQLIDFRFNIYAGFFYKLGWNPNSDEDWPLLILKYFIFGALQLIYSGKIVYSAVATIIPLFGCWLYGIQLANTIMADEEFMATGHLRFFEIHKQLEVIEAKLNFMLRNEVIPFLFSAMAACFCFCLLLLVKGEFGIATGLTAHEVISCLAIFLILQGSFMYCAKFQKILTQFNNSSQDSILKKGMESCAPLIFYFGSILPLDRDAYFFFWDIIINYTMTVLVA